LNELGLLRLAGDPDAPISKLAASQAIDRALDRALAESA
jgi:hypothetical protein